MELGWGSHFVLVCATLGVSALPNFHSCSCVLPQLQPALGVARHSHPFCCSFVFIIFSLELLAGWILVLLALR